MAKAPMNRTRTEPGLGLPESLLRRGGPSVSGEHVQSQVAAEAEDAPAVSTKVDVASGVGASAGEELPPPSGFDKPADLWAPEASTGTRHRGRTILVDDVGDAAVKIAASVRPSSAPKLVATRTTIAKAPIDTRAAFVLSLVDGQNSVDAIVDMSGMSADEVNSILARLVRLGLITVP